MNSKRDFAPVVNTHGDMRYVCALYIDPKGPYPEILGPDRCWDEKRDARTYDGPWPVVAHPPCGPWSKLRHIAPSTAKDCALVAVSQVRRFGGVLEHPAASRLWGAAGLPEPGGQLDGYGGFAIEVEQVRWGHVARKRTWLYLVGVRELGEFPPAREPTHWLSGFREHSRRGQRGSAVPEGIKVASAQQRRRTPVNFACWLISLAAQAGGTRI